MGGVKGTEMLCLCSRNMSDVTRLIFFKSDVGSAGVGMLYHILRGELPYGLMTSFIRLTIFCASDRASYPSPGDVTRIIIPTQTLSRTDHRPSAHFFIWATELLRVVIIPTSLVFFDDV